MYLLMDTLDNPLPKPTIQTGLEIFIQPYPNRRLGCMYHPERQVGGCSFPTRTRNPNDSQYPLLIPVVNSPLEYVNLSFGVIIVIGYC